MKRSAKPPKKSSKTPSAPRRGKGASRPDPGYRPERDKQARKGGASESPKSTKSEPTKSTRQGERKGKPARPAAARTMDQRSPRPEARVVSRPTATPKPTPKPAPRPSAGPRPNLFGLHAVREAWLNPKRSIHALYLTPEAEKIFADWPMPAVARPAPVLVPRDTLDRMLGRRGESVPVHQGFGCSAAPLEEVFVRDLISIGLGQDRSVILMLDQVTDPHNVGAILRSASAFGAHGVVMQKRHAPELEGVLCKTASGAVEHLSVSYETNLSRALEELKDSGYVVVGLDEHAPMPLSALPKPDRCVFVLGNEGEGMRRLIREHCDHLVTLPTQKPINSLNVSNAAAVALYALGGI